MLSNQKHWAKIMGMIVFNFLSQFLELLSSIGFVPEGVSCRKLDRIARNGNGDAVERASGPDLNCNNLVSPLMKTLSLIFLLSSKTIHVTSFSSISYRRNREISPKFNWEQIIQFREQNVLGDQQVAPPT